MSETAFRAAKEPCVRCGEFKPIRDFAKRMGTDDGRRGICKVCHNERQRALYRARNPKRPRNVRNRTCRACQVTKPVSEFNGSWICRECQSPGEYRPPPVEYPVYSASHSKAGRVKLIKHWTPGEVARVIEQIDD